MSKKNTEHTSKIKTKLFCFESTGNLHVIKSIKGKVLLTIESENVSIVESNDSLIYKSQDFYGIVSLNGKILDSVADRIQSINWELSDGSYSFIVSLPSNDKTIWNSKSGFINSLYKTISYCTDGLVIVSTRRKMGVFHLEKGILLDTIYSDVFYLEDLKRFIIKDDNSYSLLNIDMIKVVQNQKIISFIGKEYFIIQNDSNCSIVDINGKSLPEFEQLDNDDWIINDNNDFIFPCLPYFKKNGSYGFINLNSMNHKIGISKNPIHFFSGSAVVCNDKNLYGLIDTNGNFLNEYQFAKLTFCIDHFNYDYPILNNIGFPYIAQNISSEKFCLVSFNGNFLTDFIYDSISENENYSMSTNMYFFLKFKKGDKMGIMDIFGNEYFSDYFEYIDNKIYEQEEDILLLNPDDLEINQQNYPLYILKENHIHTIDDLPKNNVVFHAKKGEREGFINLNGEFIN
jgi:hypothetical protein